MIRGKDYRIDLLRQVPVFAALGKGHLHRIAKMADEVDVKRGKILVSQGDIGLEFVLIVEGQAKVVRDGKIVNYVADGDFFGEIALLDGNRRIASVIAETDMKLLVVHKQYFAGLLKETPSLHRAIHVALCQYIRQSIPTDTDRSRLESERILPKTPSTAQPRGDVFYKRVGVLPR